MIGVTLTSLRTDLRVFQIQDAIDLLELDGYSFRVTGPGIIGVTSMVHLYADNGTETVSIASFEVEN